MTRSRTLIVTIATASLVLTGATGATAAETTYPWEKDWRHGSTVESFDLPVGFQPEGIDISYRKKAYLGSLADGSIYRADLKTGKGRVISPAIGVPAVGVEADFRGRLFVAGGPSGTARVVSTLSGEVLAQYQLGEGGAPAFINDVVVTKDAAWFTDSMNPVLYRVPLTLFGPLPSQDQISTVPLTGDLEYDSDPATFELNGIETTPDRSALLVVQSRTGYLFRVDTGTGATTRVDLGDETVVNGDGLTRSGTTLYAVQNQLNQIAVVTLAADGRSGQVDRRLADPRLDIPTTVAVSGSKLYLPNARFGVESPETAEYSVIGVPRY